MRTRMAAAEGQRQLLPPIVEASTVGYRDGSDQELDSKEL